jgi:hypothetical protein
MPSDKPSPPDEESLGSRVLRVATAIKVAVMGEPEPAAAVPPTAPTYLSATARTATSVSLTWQASVTSEPVAYTVFYRIYGAPNWSVGGVSPACSATVSGLSPATEYEFEIFAHST